MAVKNYRVRASHCDHKADDEEIYRTLKRTTEPLEESWARLEKAKRIVLKFNLNMPEEKLAYFEGRLRELVDYSVARAVLRLLRERTSAELIVTDTDAETGRRYMGDDFNYKPLLDEFGVGIDDSNLAPFATCEVPGGGFMFDRYTLSGVFEEADEVVSVAKMKNHAFMGVTLCTKNLFGLVRKYTKATPC